MDGQLGESQAGWAGVGGGRAALASTSTTLPNCASQGRRKGGGPPARQRPQLLARLKVREADLQGRGCEVGGSAVGAPE